MRILEFFILQNKAKFTYSYLENNALEHIVLESIAPHMHLNYFKYFNQSGSEHSYLVIKCFDKTQFTKIEYISFFTIFYEYLTTFIELIPALYVYKLSGGNVSLRKQARQGLPVFVYLTCLFKKLKQENSELRVFSGGPHLASAAAIAQGLETAWLSHGLIDRALPFEDSPSNETHFISYPSFNSIYLYSEDEAVYLKDFGIESELCIYPSTKIVQKMKKIIFFLSPSHDASEKKLLIDVLNAFKQNKYEIVIKLHPTYEFDIEEEIIFNQGYRVIETHLGTSGDLMQKEAPEFACSFASTTLCEALYKGVIPICLTPSEILADQHPYPYPFLKRSISWKTEKDIVLNYLQDTNQTENTKSILKRLEGNVMIEPNTKVSVIILSYNQSEYVAQAIKSVISQTYQNLEIIISDNGSTDSTKEIIGTFLYDKRVIFMDYKENLAIGLRQNQAVQKASGGFISILYADDYYLESKIEHQMELFSSLSSEWGVVHGPGISLDQKTGNQKPMPSYIAHGNCLKELFKGYADGFINPIAPLVRKEVFLEFPLYEDVFSEGESLYWRIAIKYNAVS